MKRRKSARAGVSLGTVVMLLTTALVLAGFLLLLPAFTGNQDIRIDAAKLAVAMDQSFSQLAASTEQLLEKRPQNLILPSEILATAPPAAERTAAPSATPVPPPPKRSFSLCAAGNIEWNASVRKTLTFNDASQFHILTDQLQGVLAADVSYAALAHTLSASAKLSDVNMPAEILQPLRSAGINTVAIGHKHILNSGLNGLSETEQAVHNAGLTPLGPASQPAYVLQDYNGVRVALLHYLEELSSTGRKQVSEAERNEAIALIDEARIVSDISNAKNAGAEVVIVSLRWGKSGASSPTEEQAALTQALADAGADIILGTGSGVLQPVRVLSANRGDQRYHPVLCAYSLGNLFSHERQNRTTLCSILLRTEVVYDSATQTVAFENLSYTPTYAWRGKENKRTIVRILLNDGVSYPEFVASDQQKVMERCFKLVNDVMADSGIPMAE